MKEIKAKVATVNIVLCKKKLLNTHKLNECFTKKMIIEQDIVWRRILKHWIYGDK